MRNIVIKCWVVSFLACSLFAGEQTAASDHEMLVKAWENLRLGRWDVVEKALPKLESSQNATVACEALFLEGNFWQFRRPEANPEKALAVYEKIVRDHPQSALAPGALLAQARIADLDVLHPRREEAISIYRRVLAEYPQSAAAQEAVCYMAEALFLSKGKEGALEAVKGLGLWRDQHPQPGYAAEIELLEGELYRYPLENNREAVNHLMAALDLSLVSLPQQTSACWTIADLAEHRLNDREIAIKYYTRFLKEFPNNGDVFMAKMALKRLGAPLPVTEDFSLEGVMRGK